jgi:hypothetical protein
MKTDFACVVAGLTLASCVVINDGNADVTTAQPAKEAPQLRGALTGKRQLIASFYATGPDCTSLGYPTLKVAKQQPRGAHTPSIASRFDFAAR